MPADTTTLTNVPSTRVRFSAEQLKPIFMGLDDLVKENNHVRATGSLRRYPDLADEYGRFNCHKAPTDEQMSAILSAHEKVQSRLETGGWVRLDHREVAACYLAVSHAKRIVQKKHAKAWAPDYKAAVERLRASLEMYRKRAIKLLPVASQKPARLRIVADLREVKQRLAKSVVARKRTRFERRHARELVDKAVRLAVVGLGMKGYEAPSDVRCLTPVVRARLRNYARKSSGETGIRGKNSSDARADGAAARSRFLSDEISAALMLADYVIQNSENLELRKKPAESSRARHATVVGGNTVLPVPSIPTPIPPAPREKEIHASVRIACSELEWLMMEDFDGKSAWSRMSRAARVAAIAQAKQGGEDLSNRRIARIVGVDDKTVARMLREAALPLEDHDQIARGKKSSSQALREANDPVYQQSKRLARERRDGSVTAEHAEQIVSYVREFRLSRETVLRAKEIVSGLKQPEWLRTRVPRIDVGDLVSASAKIDVGAAPDDLGIEQPARRLCWWLLHVAPEREIYLEALDKALCLLPCRAAWGRVC